MIFGVPVTPVWMLIGGFILFALVIGQVLVGLRKIKLGPRTFVYHKWIAYTILAVAVVHATFAILFVTGFNLF